MLFAYKYPFIVVSYVKKISSSLFIYAFVIISWPLVSEFYFQISI